MFYSYLFDLKDGNANVCQEQEGDPWTFQMSEILLQLRHIHYKNPQRPPHTHTQLRCKTPTINICDHSLVPSAAARAHYNVKEISNKVNCT